MRFVKCAHWAVDPANDGSIRDNLSSNNAPPSGTGDLEKCHNHQRQARPQNDCENAVMQFTTAHDVFSDCVRSDGVSSAFSVGTFSDTDMWTYGS